MRLLVLISSLRRGGAEKAATTLANRWTAQGREVTVGTLAAVEAPEWPLDPSVARVALDKRSDSSGRREAVIANLRRLRSLRALMRSTSPDLVVSFVDTTNVLAVMASRGLGIPVVVAERSHPGQVVLPRPWVLLRDLVYRRAAAVVVQTERSRAWAQSRVGAERTFVIPNAVAPAVVSPPEPARSPQRVIGLGRLGPEKGFDIALRAFARVADRHPGWELVIHGEGRDRPTLESLVGELGLGRRVRLPGQTTDPLGALSAGDLFVLPSRYEGFPQALLEAMAAGLPVIAADCLTGPREIVRDGVDGVLVPVEDPEAMAGALDRLMSDQSRRRELGQAARAVTERFGAEAIERQWESVLQRATAQPL